MYPSSPSPLARRAHSTSNASTTGSRYGALTPQTPSTSLARKPLSYKPLNSSPLVDFDSPDGDNDNDGDIWQKSSPVAAAQARRKSMYKAAVSMTPMRRTSSSGTTNGRGSLSRNLFSDLASASKKEDPRKRFLRDKLKARCLEQAVRARDKAVRGRRHGGGHIAREPSSDGFDVEMDDMDDDGEEDDEAVLQDELYRRIVANANRQQKHSYKVSYAQEVGSSFDPDLEDVTSWERELAPGHSASDSHTISKPSTSTSISTFPSSSGRSYAINSNKTPSRSAFITPSRPTAIRTISTPRTTATDTNGSSNETPSIDDEIPPDFYLSDEELEEYAEEYARLKVLQDFEDIPEDELFAELNDEELETVSGGTASSDATMVTAMTSMQQSSDRIQYEEDLMDIS